MRVLIAFCLLFAFAAHADENPGFSIYPHIGGTGTAPGTLQDDHHGGLAVGYRFDSPLSVELRHSRGTADLVNPLPGDADFQTNSFSLLYNFDTESNLTPFASLGFADTNYRLQGLNDDESVAVGLGVKWYFSDKAALRADGQLFKGGNDDTIETGVSVGLHFNLGGTREAAAPAPEVIARSEGDADNDGVVDSLDRCPGTPMGVAVDADGCPLDDDGDGVPNYQDKCPNTTDRRARIDADGCYQKLTKMVSIDLRVEFDFDSAKARPEHSKEVKRVADFMNSYPSTSVVMEGHTDSTGDARYNQGLSERRAKTIADMLVNDFGISQSRVDSKGYGEDKPVATNDTKEGRQQNRRVVASIEEQEQEIEMK